MDGATGVVIMVKQDRWFGASGFKLEGVGLGSPQAG